MILTSKKLTANVAKLSEQDRNELIEQAKTSPNLLLNSNLGEGDNFWTPCGEEVVGLERAITNIEGFMNFTNTFVLAGSGAAGEMYGFSQNFYAEIGKYYTGSFYYKFLTPVVTGKNQLRLKVGETIKIINQEDSEWNRVDLTTVAGQTILEFCVALTGEQENIMVEFTGLQVEKGQLVSDWQLSQQDILNAQKKLQESVGLLEEAVAPERIIQTVTLSEEYINAFNAKASYEDISGLANSEEMAVEFDRINQYVQQVESDKNIQVSELTSKFEKSAAEILAHFGMSAGINLIRNSTGFFEADFWEKVGTVSNIANDEIEQKAIGSAFYSKNSFTLTQEIAVKPNTPYSFSFWQKKTTTGKSIIKLKDGSTTLYEIGHADETTANFENPFIVNFITGESQSTVTISIENFEGVESFFSGLMLNEGSIALQWSSHPEEIANTNIRFNLNGIYVKNQETNSYTVMSPTEFSGYAEVMAANGDISTKRIFTLNGETTEVYKLNAEKGIIIGGIAAIPLETTLRNGLAFFA